MKRVAARDVALASLGFALLLAMSGCGAGHSLLPAATESSVVSPEAGDGATGGRLAPILLDEGRVSRMLEEAEVAALQPDAEVSEAQAAAAASRCPQWDGNAVVRWNEVARSLVIDYLSYNPVRASRVYALVTVAQHEALLAASSSRACGGHRGGVYWQMPGSRGELNPALASVAVAAASATVLSYLFPQEAPALAALAWAHERWCWQLKGGDARDLVNLVKAIGRQVGLEVVAYARRDGADTVATIPVRVPQGKCYWKGKDPLEPRWGKVRPWLLRDGDQIRPGPPPDCGSQPFLAALNEVRVVTQNLTPKQKAIARYWEDDVGTYTNPGHFNYLACDLIERYRFGELLSARVLALMNMAVQDGGIACWDAKYTYWLIRPYQADPRVRTVVAEPPFPSYPSGHSTFGGAAEPVLTCFFPREAATIHRWAEENSISRLYGGVHYRFDLVQGLRMGRMVGELAVRLAR